MNYSIIIQYFLNKMLNMQPGFENSTPTEEKPLKMPENYSFSQRGVNWKNYASDYLLRTDAVWEKSKMLAYFYSLYKAVDILNNFRKESIMKRGSTMMCQWNTSMTESVMAIK